jgi:hypothetical protein
MRASAVGHFTGGRRTVQPAPRVACRTAATGLQAGVSADAIRRLMQNHTESEGSSADLLSALNELPSTTNAIK